MADFAQLFSDAANRFKVVPATLDPAEADRRVRRAEAHAARLTCRAIRAGWLPWSNISVLWPEVPATPRPGEEEPWVMAWRTFTYTAALCSRGLLPADCGDTRPVVVRDEAGVWMLSGEYRPDGWQERAADYAALCAVLAESGSTEPPPPPPPSDGPGEQGKFHYQGNTATMEPTPWRLLEYVWKHGRDALLDGAIEYTWGYDGATVATARVHATRVNNALLEARIPFALSIRGPRILLQ